MSKLQRKDSTYSTQVKDNLKTQNVETKEVLEKLKVERAEIRVPKDEIHIKVQEASSKTKTNNHPDIPWQITEDLEF